jgi:aspartyl protease family protein
MRAPVILKTANGQTMAELVTIKELRFGNIVARDRDAVVAPGLGETNVLGMNFLSRLKSWRVEGRTLVLVPNNPQAPVADETPS